MALRSVYQDLPADYYPIDLIAPGAVPGDDGLGACGMRRDELMKPDLFSEMLLTTIGLAMLIFLMSTLWIAIFGH